MSEGGQRGDRDEGWTERCRPQRAAVDGNGPQWMAAGRSGWQRAAVDGNGPQWVAVDGRWSIVGDGWLVRGQW